MISYEKNTKSPIYCHPCGSYTTCLSCSDIEKDSIKPEITISGTIAYDGTQSDEELLKNVVANDKKDGDVTDTLVVKSIIILSSGKEAKITYAAKDRSNNVAIKSIVVPYTGTAKPIEKPDEEPTTEDETTTPEEETTTKQKPEETTPVETVSPDAPVLYLTQTTATLKKVQILSGYST